VLKEGRIWRVLIVVNLVVVVVLALWVALFATGTDSLLPPALDPNAEVREEVAELSSDTQALRSDLADIETDAGSSQGLETWGGFPGFKPAP